MVRASDSQCHSRNCPGFDPSILRHSGILEAADEAVLNIVNKKIKNISLFKITAKLKIIFGYEPRNVLESVCGSPPGPLCVYSAASEGLKGKPITGPKLKKPPPSFLYTSHRKPKTFYTGNRREVIGHVVFGFLKVLSCSARG